MFGWFAKKRQARATHLRLTAETSEDVAVLAALCQDALIRHADMQYDPKARTFTLTLSRYCHETDQTTPLRATSALQIGGVLKAAARGIDGEDVLSLMTLQATPSEPPGHSIELIMAGEAGRAVRLDVECLDILLVDLTPPRRSRNAPQHGF